MGKNGPIALTFHTCFVVFTLAPLVLVCLVAFTPESYLSLPTSGLSLRWFSAMLERRDFVDGFKTSAVLASISASLSLVITVPAAVAIARYDFAGRTAILTLLQFPLMIPHLVLGIAFLRFLSSLGLYATMTGLVIAHVIMITPFMLRLVLAACAGFDRRIEDAAVSLGAHQFTVFRRIFIPAILPGLASGWMLAFITSFDEVTMTVFVAAPATTTLPVRMFLYIQDSINPLIAAVSATLIVFTVLQMVIIDRIYGLDRIFSGEGRDTK